MNKPEILAPAGSFDSLTAAVRCGADAVYLGGRKLNARRNAANFSDEELAQAVEYCHARGVKVYITLNTLVRDDESDTAMNAVRCACDIKADALILQDIGLASLVRRAAPDMPLQSSFSLVAANAWKRVLTSRFSLPVEIKPSGLRSGISANRWS